MYGKIFASMYDGSLYGNWQAIVTFQQMIVLCGPDGVIDMTPQALAARTSIPLEVIHAGIETLEAPDKYSRSPEHEGRRIERLDARRPWGWRIVNHEKYRALKDPETVREQNRLRQQRKRERDPEGDCHAASRDVTQCHAASRDVTQCHAESRHTDTDTDTDTEAEAKEKTNASLRAADLVAEGVSEQVAREYLELRKRKRATLSPTALEGLKREAESAGWSLEQALRECLERGWTGFKASWVAGQQKAAARDDDWRRRVI
jgi:hypothetical protein